MQNRESFPNVARRAVVISPKPRLTEELAPLIEAKLPGVAISHVKSYPSPRELTGAIGGGTQYLVFLDVISDRDQAIQLINEIAKLGSSVQVVALLPGNDPDLILRCLRAGAVDFLLQPFTADQMEAALGKLARAQPAGPPGKEPAKIFTVMPAKGGCGATTVACNLAFQWKRLGAKKILLADLDALTGTFSFLLKIKSTHSFMDVLLRQGELDTDLWGGMVTHVNGVDILLAPEIMTEGVQDLRDPGPILDYARNAYDVVITDAGSVYGDWNLAQARAANELLLVTTNELPALQAAQRALSYLDTNRIGRWKVRLVVNRYTRDVGLSREVIGTALHADVFDTLPSDYETVQKALMEGKPVLSNTSFGKSISQLADRLSGGGETTKKVSPSGLLGGGLFGLFSKTSK
jgi:pilus assembly protein CpaE